MPISMSGSISFSATSFDVTNKQLEMNVRATLSKAEVDKLNGSDVSLTVIRSGTTDQYISEVESTDQLEEVIIIGWLDTESFELNLGNVGNNISFELDGDTFLFPFDVYTAEFVVSPVALSSATSVYADLGDYHLTLEQIEIGRFHVSVQRDSFDRIFAMAFVIPLIVLAILFVVKIRKRNFGPDSMLSLFLVIIAVPSILIFIS